MSRQERIDLFIAYAVMWWARFVERVEGQTFDVTIFETSMQKVKSSSREIRSLEEKINNPHRITESKEEFRWYLYQLIQDACNQNKRLFLNTSMVPDGELFEVCRKAGVRMDIFPDNIEMNLDVEAKKIYLRKFGIFEPVNIFSFKNQEGVPKIDFPKKPPRKKIAVMVAKK